MSDSIEMELMKEFFIEAKELIENLDSDFVRLESEPENEELINEIFRYIHTIKGGAGMLGLVGLETVAHRMEDILNKIRKGEASLTDELSDSILAGLDTIKKIVAVLESGGDSTEIDLTVVDRLTEVYRSIENNSPESSEVDDENLEEKAAKLSAEVEKESEEFAVEIFSDDMKELYESFVIETDEIIETLDQDFVQLESSPDDEEVLNSIFRGMHTIKGTSSFLGMELITKLSHKAEDVLNDLRKEELHVTTEIMDVLLETLDFLRILLDDVRAQKLVDRDIMPLVSTLVSFRGDQEVSNDKDVKKDRKKDIQTKTSQTGKDMKKPITKPFDTTIRVDVDRLDSLMNLVSELVLRRNALVQFTKKFEKNFEDSDYTEEMNTTTANLSYLTTELQFAVMKTRMLPIGKVFNKFTRIVRDLSREFDKKINLKISGSETELDKSLIEEINDPLVHIIRNAVDHGVESPEERRLKGKNEVGNIHLYAAQEGNNIIIGVTDDGKGLLIDKLKTKAVERGMISESEASRMPKNDAFNLIFAPGFSTAEKVTNVSGRGVGMDVVKTNISRLNGTVSIDSSPGEGTKFTIKLPLTLAIIQGLLVGVEDEVFVIPLSTVLETARVNKSQIKVVHQHEVITLRDSIIPLVRLTSLFDITPSKTSRINHDIAYVVVLGLAEERVGLVVSRMMGQEEVVIKSLGEDLGKSKGVSGVTIMGDGRVRMILEIRDIFDLARTNSTYLSSHGADPVEEIVDVQADPNGESADVATTEPSHVERNGDLHEEVVHETTGEKV